MLHQIYPQVQHGYAYELNKDMHIAAAHYIPDEKAGKCQNVHGHTYFVNVTIAGDELDDQGFLVNFAKLKKLVHGKFDHTLLNDHAEFGHDTPDSYPSTEAVARTIYDIIQKELNRLDNRPECVQVFVRETPTSYVIYRPKRSNLHE
ncbi:MAG: 6-carboxytetrahydropterin synthase QueD [Bacillaceae bacterium]|nr:6-carboxytetrahydropterin synthase QueD [Bacillaceae bacterium]